MLFRKFITQDKTIIAIEGIDGAGKTTLINKIREEFLSDTIVYNRTQKSNATKRLVSFPIIRKIHALQIPIYLFLSWRNLYNLEPDSGRIVIMDRCFLSNICYFYPKAMDNRFLFRLVMLFEPRIYPQKIYVIDVAPKDAYFRNNKEKSLKWLKKTRLMYIKSATARCLSNYNVELIPYNYSVEMKAKIIMDYLKMGGRYDTR